MKQILSINWRNFKKFQFTKIQKNEFSAKYITGLRRNALASIIIYFIILACMILGGLFFIYDIKEAIFIFFLLSMGLIIYFVRNYRKTNLKLFFLEFKDNNFNHKLETLNQVMRDIVNHPERGAVYFNQNHKLLLWNKAYEKLFNFPEGYLKYKMPFSQCLEFHSKMISLDNITQESYIKEQILKLQQDMGEVNQSHQINFHDGTEYNCQISSKEDQSILISYSNVSNDEKQYDNLTNLPNRILFKSYLHSKLSQVSQNKTKIAIMHLGIDSFKDINDTFGYHAGDQFIVKFTNKLRSFTGDNCFVARLGGDEFAIIKEENITKTEMRKIASYLVKMISKPFVIDGQLISIKVYLGMVLCDGQEEIYVDQVIKNGTIALHNAKEKDHGAIVEYTSEMHSKVLRRTALQSDIHLGMSTSQFRLEYQPQIDIITRKIIGVEALMRWNHPVHGRVNPEEFIAVAEFSKQIIPLTEKLVPEACVQSNIWDAQGLDDICMSVNISPLHFRGEGLVDFIKYCLAETNIDPMRLELEITEGVVMLQSEDVINSLNALSELGIKMAVDDFGKGYSSLSYLRRLPVHKLKIDKEFIDDLGQNKNARQVIDAIIKLGHSFNLKVIAEGVETKEQLKILEALGCDQAQGYYISKPLPAVEITKWVVENRGRY